jgi:HD-GYP domain-containing protein (c-di-GMP phosphodiesterase class II)
VYDALAMSRPYRPALPLEQCLTELRAAAAGGGLAPELLRAFCAPHPVPGARRRNGR